MNKKIAAILSVSGLLLLSSCQTKDSNNNNNALYSRTEPDRFTYENTELENNAGSIFGIDENNTLYVLNNDADGKINIKTYGENGTETGTLSVDFGETDDGTEFMSAIYPAGMDIYKDKVYILCNASNNFRVYVYDIDSNKITDMYDAQNFSSIEKIEANADGIYLLGTMNGGEYVSEEYTDENGNKIYFECTQKIIEYITADGNFKRLETEYPAAFTAKRNGGIIIYAFDKTGGYYFTEFNNDSLGKKNYNNSYGLLNDIDVFGNGNDIIVSGINNHKLCAGSAESDSGISDVLENVFIYFTEDVKCNSDYVFFKSGEDILSETEKVSRISLEAIENKGRINVISTQFAAELPFSNGYEINSEQLSADMFSTKLLAMSGSFDISCFSSSAGYAKNFQSSGAYYALNDIDGVEEYLDGCFPYLKEACINEKGQIWALPIQLDIPVIVYNKQNCEKIGFNFDRELTLDEFSDIVYKANECDLRYDCIRYRFVESMLAQYLQNNDKFDTDEFRTLAVFIKEKCGTDIFKYDPMIYSDMMVYNVNKKLGMADIVPHSEYDSIFFTLLHTNEEQTKYISEDENICAVPLPKLFPDYKNNAVCTFLCVNPGAENLENAKKYISMLTTELAGKKNGMMLISENSYTDNDYCRALRDIYSDGQIYFAVPESIYYEEFDSYCADGTDLEAFIRDADEKMKIYLWEKE